MDVTSNHLDVFLPNARGTWGDEDSSDQPDPGEELTKRGEYFGHPVGKSAQCLQLQGLLTDNAILDYR